MGKISFPFEMGQDSTGQHYILMKNPGQYLEKSFEEVMNVSRKFCQRGSNFDNAFFFVD